MESALKNYFQKSQKSDMKMRVIRMKLSNAEVKRQNKIAAYRELLRHERTTKPELASRLKLSLPTIGQIVGELVEAGLATEDGIANSIGGRRAVYYSPTVDAKLALGADITQNHISLALVDLSGKMLCHERSKLVFVNEPSYNDRVNAHIHRFLKGNNIDTASLIGVGCSLPGIISQDRKNLEISHILKVTREKPFSYVPDFPCEYLLFNDADAACMVECYAEDGLESFVFLSLSNTVGGALTVNKNITRGLMGRCGELGHVCIDPSRKARMCYCGKRGHYDAYGSARLLAEKADSTLENFFARVEQGDPEMMKTLDEYLSNLAILLENTIMFVDMPVVIGGYVGSFLGPYLDLLKEKVAARDNLEFSSVDHIHLCRRKVEAAAVGSALYFVEKFIREL